MIDQETFIPSANGQIVGKKLIGRCKDCEHWEARFCQREDPLSKLSPDDWISADCLETGALQVGPNFGCVHWKAKE